MKLFQGLDAEAGALTVMLAVFRLQAGLARLSGAGPHSLCELVPDEDDYAWLQRWAAELKPETIDRAPWESGALALLLISEKARREAREGHVWPVVGGLFHPAIEERLYVRGQAKPLLKDLLHQAAVQLHLRHVFDREVGQNWYLSIYLQFGFTLNGMRDNLPYWLAGHKPPDSVALLRDGALAGPSFQRFWAMLRDYRKGRLREDDLRREVRSSPWALPAWEDDLVRLARERLDLPEFVDGPSQAIGNLERPEAETRPSILQFPRLHWDFSEDPVFLCGWSDLGPLSLDESHYRLKLGLEALGSLFRQPDGGYRADPPNEVRLPVTSSSPIVGLVGPSGETVISQALELWCPADDVTVYRTESGEAIDVSTTALKPNRSYLVLTPDDLIVDPAQPVWRRLGPPSELRLTLLSPGWSTDVRVIDQSGTVIWRPVLGEGPSPNDEPAWASDVWADWDGGVASIGFGEKIRIKMSGLGTDVKVISLRLGGKPLAPRHGRRDVTAEVVTTPELVSGGLRLGIGLRKEGEHVHVHRRLRPVIAGAARIGDKGWEAMNPDGILTVREARESHLRAFLAEGMDLPPDRKVALIEGGRTVGELGERARRIHSLAGLGGPLEARRERYNAPETLFRLASAVFDFGVIRHIEFLKLFKSVQIHLTQSIQPGTGHTIVWWKASGEVHFERHGAITARENGLVWLVPCPWPESIKDVVVGIAYEGEHLGSASPTNDSKRFFKAMVPNDGSADRSLAAKTAALARWFRLPIMLGAHDGRVPYFSAFCRACPAAVLATWLNDDVPAGLHQLRFGEPPEVMDAAWTVLRRIFADWRSRPRDAVSIVHGLGRYTPSDPLVDIVQRLLPRAPVLAGRIVRDWFAAQGLDRPGKALADKQVRRLVRLALGLGGNSLWPEVDHKLNARLAEAAESSSFNGNAFRAIGHDALSLLEGKQLSPVEARNIEAALEIGGFRSYLGALVLKWVADHLHGTFNNGPTRRSAIVRSAAHAARKFRGR